MVDAACPESQRDGVAEAQSRPAFSRRGPGFAKECNHRESPSGRPEDHPRTADTLHVGGGENELFVVRNTAGAFRRKSRRKDAAPLTWRLAACWLGMSRGIECPHCEDQSVVECGHDRVHIQLSRALASSSGKYSQGSVDRMMRSQNSDLSRYFASREQLGCELGEREECHDGILPRTASDQ